jgi:hypothetical protein
MKEQMNEKLMKVEDGKVEVKERLLRRKRSR